MQATFKIQAEELNDQLILQIKKIFEGRPVTIYISTEMDETEYLRAYPTNIGKYGFGTGDKFHPWRI